MYIHYYASANVGAFQGVLDECFIFSNICGRFFKYNIEYNLIIWNVIDEMFIILCEYIKYNMMCY